MRRRKRKKSHTEKLHLDVDLAKLCGRETRESNTDADESSVSLNHMTD